MRKIIPKLMIISVILFVAGIVWGGASAIICTHSNHNYKELQEEFTTELNRCIGEIKKTFTQN